MKYTLADMIDSYIKHKKKPQFNEIELYKKNTLKEFFVYISAHKNNQWDIKDISFEDGLRYYKYLSRNEPTEYEVNKKIQVLNHFMDYATTQGWLDKAPWRYF